MKLKLKKMPKIIQVTMTSEMCKGVPYYIGDRCPLAIYLKENYPEIEFSYVCDKGGVRDFSNNLIAEVTKGTWDYVKYTNLAAGCSRSVEFELTFLYLN